MFSLTTGWTWARGAATALTFLGYHIWQLLTSLTQIQIVKTVLYTTPIELKELNMSIAVAVLQYMMIQEIQGLQTS